MFTQVRDDFSCETNMICLK